MAAGHFMSAVPLPRRTFLTPPDSNQTNTPFYTQKETDMHPGYAATGNALADRIEKLIPSHPEILTMDDPFKLFKVEGFNCDDLGPSLAQAGWALREAQERYKRSTHTS